MSRRAIARGRPFGLFDGQYLSGKAPAASILTDELQNLSAGRVQFGRARIFPVGACYGRVGARKFRGTRYQRRAVRANFGAVRDEVLGGADLGVAVHVFFRVVRVRTRAVRGDWWRCGRKTGLAAHNARPECGRRAEGWDVLRVGGKKYVDAE